MEIDAFIKEFHRQIDHLLDEKTRRLLMAAEASTIGRGGISLVAKANKASRVTIKNGIRELSGEADPMTTRIRRDGGGRKKLIDQENGLWLSLSKLLNPHKLTDPECILQWTDKSFRNLSMDLSTDGYSVSHVTLGRILEEAGFSLQANRKTVEKVNPDERNAQFERINNLAKRFLNLGYPVIAVDLKKKKENAKYRISNPGTNKSGKGAKIKACDFTKQEGCDALLKEGEATHAANDWESMGIFRDTAAFAVSSIKSWWINMGSKKFTSAKKILIIADGGGSESSRAKPWRTELQKLARYLQMEIHVSHFPPATTKWHKIEHSLITNITKHWNVKKDESIAVIVHLISAKTDTGLLKPKTNNPSSVKNTISKSTNSKDNSSGWKRPVLPSKWNYIVTQNFE